MIPDLKRIFKMGNQGLLVEFNLGIHPNSLRYILKVKKLLTNVYQEKKVDITHTYSSILIRFLHYNKIDLSYEIEYIKQVISSMDSTSNLQTFSAKKHIVPVCYASAFAMDLDFLSKQLELTKDEIIRLHTQPTYTVYFHGFLPGFLYLGGLADALYFPRKKTPRLKIPKGCVGIGGQQTGIYPSESPGGWQVIGNCPLNLFDVSQSPPVLFSAGDQIQFTSISKEEHLKITKAIAAGSYQHQIQEI